MKDTVGTRGLILNEPFLWERGGKGRTGYSLPRRDVDAAALEFFAQCHAANAFSGSLAAHCAPGSMTGRSKSLSH